MAWLFFALITAICWGAGYSLTEKVLHNGISSSFLLAGLSLISAPIYLAISVYGGGFKSSIDTLRNDTNNLFLFTILAISIYIVGNLTIMHAIQLKNATYANLIEITYPLFTIFFTFLFFKNIHLDLTAILGALLIVSGMALILYKGA